MKQLKFNFKLARAAAKGRAAECRVFLGQGADAAARDGNGYTPFCHAILNGHNNCLCLFKDHGAELNFDQGEHPTAVALLLLRFPNPSGDSKPATTRSGSSGTEPNGAGDRRTVETPAAAPGIGAAILATTISEFFHSICKPTWWFWESASASRPSPSARVETQEVTSQTADFERLQLDDERGPVRQRQKGELPRAEKPRLQA